LRKRVDLACCDKKTQALGETSHIKSREVALTNDKGVVRENEEGLSRKQVKDDMNKEGCEDKMPAEMVEEGIEMIEVPSILEAKIVEREKKLEDLSRVLATREKQLEVREIQVKEKESDMAKNRQNIKNIKNIIDEKQLLSRKLSDMELELQTERSLRKKAQSLKEEAERNVQKMASRLEASLLLEGQEKSDLMAQCQILGSQLQALVKEVEMSRETVEKLSFEVENWKRMAQDGKTLNHDFSSKEAKEVRLCTPQPQVLDSRLFEVNPRSEEIIDLKEAEEIEVGGVSGEAGRRKGEALDLLRIHEDEEDPKSGSRMDFGEKKVFFQRKIEAEINSPSLRERT